jgi:pyruvate,water dikinase
VWLRGRQNLRVMLPFVRTPRDVEGCLPTFDRAGLLEDPRFQLWVMAEVPSVLYHLAAYRDLGIHGISIGTNDLTQLMLGADRDSERLARYDAMDPAVLQYVHDLLHDATSLGLATSICGQAPAVHPGYVDGLVRAGIGSISVTSDALDATRAAVARAERRILLEAARA